MASFSAFAIAAGAAELTGNDSDLGSSTLGGRAPASDQGLEEIIVTAEKRSESINKVPLAITALSGNTLQDQNIHSVQDLALVVPGFTYAASLLDTPVYSLRGVGFYETTLAAYPDVSIYVDQVPLPFPVLTQNVGLDLERVEVLKGPQGVLFGQNSTGGAINYIAAKPTDKPEGGFDFGYGRFNDTRVDGFVSGPVADTLNARFAFQTEQMGPWQHSYHTPTEQTSGSISRSSARLLVDWTPSDKLKFEFNASGGVDRSEPIVPQLIGVSLQAPDSPVNGPFLLAYPHAPNNADAADYSLLNKPRSNNSQYQFSLRGDFTPGSDLTVTSITSYVHYLRDENVEFGGVSVNTANAHNLGDEELALDFAQINSIFQELRVANSTSDVLRWVAGTNFEHSSVHEFNLYDYAGSSEADSPGVAAALTRNLTNTPFYSD
ncbi:MAG TPA: TonB-dependent receptor plug domain-containing protein, partial [Steroidobacteraceae bacterium]|nr:TonB-dependent receptor plug domain-containing protein [Steroidobacteraceae bacterium]